MAISKSVAHSGEFKTNDSYTEENAVCMCVLVCLLQV